MHSEYPINLNIFWMQSNRDSIQSIITLSHPAIQMNLISTLTDTLPSFSSTVGAVRYQAPENPSLLSTMCS